MNKNKNLILKASRSLFLKFGYNGTSLRIIAKKTKMTTGAIYFYFKNKKEIYLTICQEALDILIQKFKTGISRQGTPPEKLLSTYDSYISFYYDNQDYYNVLMEYRSAYDPEDVDLKQVLNEKMTEPVKLMSEVVSQGIKENFYSKTDPMMLSVFLAAAAEGMLQYKKIGLMDALNISDSDFRSFMVETVWNGIRKK